MDGVSDVKANLAGSVSHSIAKEKELEAIRITHAGARILVILLLNSNLSFRH
ncbi:hypothetical protein AGROH133_09368 [Agrobacterium tumefaciens]|nr:hypothetical protein AGROH133_09368 [Agrobacterium tumefaciens]